MLPAARFYLLTCAAMVVRCAGYRLLNKELYTSHKWTSPSALVPDGLLPLCGRRSAYFVVFGLMLASFAFAACQPELIYARLLAAVSYTSFSMGCAYALEWGHGQYPVLWTTWALLILPEPFDVAVARGTCVYLFVMAGLAKLYVPSSFKDYLEPESLRSLMSKDGVSPRFNPLIPSMSRAIIRTSFLLRCITWITLLLELVVMPATFVMPSYMRAAVAVICLGFHAGIWFTFSSTAGTMFYQLLGVYTFGLCGDLDVATMPWVLGATIAFAPFAWCALFGHPFAVGERWPLTNCALFPWSAQQVHFVFQHLVDGDTRLVLTVREAGQDEVIGRPVTARGGSPPTTQPLVLHNAFGNLWNWTKVYPEFVHALNAAIAAGDPAAMVAPTQAWLRSSKPLHETDTGKPLVAAHLVVLDKATGRVARVLCQPK